MKAYLPPWPLPHFPYGSAVLYCAFAHHRYWKQEVDRAEKNGKTLALKKNFSVTPKAVVKDALIASKRRKTVAVCSIPLKLFRIVCKIVPHDWILEITENFKVKENSERK